MNNAAEPKEYRYERKFVISEMSESHIESIIKIHPTLFYEKYPPRFVNNIYFDTLNFHCLFDNLDGSANRQKIRIRWYGEFYGHIKMPVLEFKIKKGVVGRKINFELPPFTFDRNLSRNDIFQVIRKSNIPAYYKTQLFHYQNILVNRYRRKYYQSADGHFRITLDTGLTFFKSGLFDHLIMEKTADRRHIIVELKYDKKVADQAERIAQGLPFRLLKNSKYVSGMIHLYA